MIEAQDEVGIPTVVSREPHYPESPGAFAASPVVEFMLERYKQYIAGREPLLAMAYVCLTRLTFDFRHASGKGNVIHKLAHEYAVEDEILDELGRLSSTLGDETGARKVHSDSRSRAPTDNERRWIERCVLALIRRAGEYAADPQNALPKITMSDLPRL